MQPAAQYAASPREWTAISASLRELADTLDSTYVERGELTRLMLMCMIAQEHLLLLGPPGSAKSAVIRDLASRSGLAPVFECLLTRFSEPNEVFGPVNIRALTDEGVYTRITTGMLPQARIAFVDEIFKANSAVLNTLLTVLNERIFFDNGVMVRVPLVSMFAASNELTHDSELAALADRFVLRYRTEYVSTTSFDDLVGRGWDQEHQALERSLTGVQTQTAQYLQSPDELAVLTQAMFAVDDTSVMPEFRRLVHLLRQEGVAISDRGVVKLRKLVRASAVLRGYLGARPLDLDVLRHTWTLEDQRGAVAQAVAPVVDAYRQAAPQEDTLKSGAPIADEIYRVQQRRYSWSQAPATSRAEVVARASEIAASRRRLLASGQVQAVDEAAVLAQESEALLQQLETLRD